jgi:hypothetical protein
LPVTQLAKEAANFVWQGCFLGELATPLKSVWDLTEENVSQNYEKGEKFLG